MKRAAMPINLKGEEHDPRLVGAFIKPKDEVFVMRCTGEVFKDYECVLIACFLCRRCESEHPRIFWDTTQARSQFGNATHCPAHEQALHASAGRHTASSCNSRHGVQLWTPGVLQFLVVLFAREYLARLDYYRQRFWTCRATGIGGLTYEQALASEAVARGATQQVAWRLVS